MQHKHFGMKISYVCIFAKTVEDASENLVRLILGQNCGFDEGVSTWCSVLADYLQTPDDLIEFNQCGATFTNTQWNQVLQQVLTALIAHQQAVS